MKSLRHFTRSRLMEMENERSQEPDLPSFLSEIGHRHHGRETVAAKHYCYRSFVRGSARIAAHLVHARPRQAILSPFLSPYLRKRIRKWHPVD